MRITHLRVAQVRIRCVLKQVLIRPNQTCTGLSLVHPEVGGASWLALERPQGARVPIFVINHAHWPLADLPRAEVS